MIIPRFLFPAALLVFFIASCSSPILQGSSSPTLIGEMKNVMWKGELAGTIKLDTISSKEHLYGMGPLEYLRGEILVMDGRAYKSTVLTDTTMLVEENFDLKAPFFGYANISKWQETPLPDSVRTIPQLEAFLDESTRSGPRPFMFKLEGKLETATIHIVNLPQGSKVSNPAQAHQGQINYPLNNETAEILGFFSTDHKAVFTHHDTFLHMHLITKDRRKMGHLDDLTFPAGSMKLFLPK